MAVFHLLFILGIFTAQNLCSGTTTTVSYKPEYAVSPNASEKCQLIPLDPDIGQTLSSIIEGTVKLIRITVDIGGGDTIFSHSPVSGDLVDPYTWNIIFGEAGESLLMLKDGFTAMSLQTLGFGIARVDVRLKQSPVNCLNETTPKAAEGILRKLLMSNFDKNQTGFSPVYPEGTKVCNKHIKELEGNTAAFVFECCDRDGIGGYKCSDLADDKWMAVLFWLINCIKLLVIGFSPLLVPAYMHRAKSEYAMYQCQTEPNTSVVVQKKDIKDIQHDAYQKVKVLSDSPMKSIASRVNDWTLGSIYTLSLSKVCIAVKANRVLPENYAPVGMVAFLNRFLVKCKLRTEVRSVSGCCTENIFKMCSQKQLETSKNRKQGVLWYQVSIAFMTFILALLLILPWVGRVLFYYEHEVSGLQLRAEAALHMGLRIASTGSLTTDLSPFHLTFVCIYILIPVEVLIFLILPQKVKRKVKFTVRKCFRDMQETDRLAAFGECIADLIRPLENCGLVGCLVMPVWFILVTPIRILVFLFEVIPVINFTIRLTVNFFYYFLKTISPSFTTKSCPEFCQPMCQRFRTFTRNVLVIDKKERNVRKNKVLHALGQLMCLLLALIVLVIAIECVSFYLECGIYLIIGIILNPNETVKYVSLALLILLYASDCFSSVKNRYINFNKSINSEIKKLVGEKLTEVAMLSENEQDNTAFIISATSPPPDQKLVLCRGAEGKLKWEARRLMMFLDKTDTARISREFFFRSCKFGHFFCPGPLHLSYLKAVAEFMTILLFLSFVFLVILAFGHAHNVSSANQTIATLAGGFLPLMFRKLLFTAHPIPSVDTTDVKWLSTIRHQIDCFKEYWLIQDFEVDDVTEETGPDEPSADLIVAQTTKNKLEFYVPIASDGELREVVYHF